MSRADNLRSDAAWLLRIPLTERIDSSRRVLIAAQFRGAANDLERKDAALRTLRMNIVAGLTTEQAREDAVAEIDRAPVADQTGGESDG